MIVVEGHLLYYRQDIVNLIDIKIMLKMSYEDACKRVKLLSKGMSRGRNIKIFNNLSDILAYAKTKEQQHVVQKYIENAMIIEHREFDIR